MRFGTFVPQGWKGDQDGVPVEEQWGRILDVARLIEASVYDSIWVYDHFHTHPVVKQESTFEAWTLMAALAAVCGSRGKTLDRFIEDLNARIGLPRGLGAMSLPHGFLPDLARAGFADHSTATNPRTLTEADLLALLEESW